MIWNNDKGFLISIMNKINQLKKYEIQLNSCL